MVLCFTSSRNGSNSSSSRRTNRFASMVALLIITTLGPLWRSSRSLPVSYYYDYLASTSMGATVSSTATHSVMNSRVETIFYEDGIPFEAKPSRTLYRQVPEFTDVTQTYDYTDSSDFDGIMEKRSFPPTYNNETTEESSSSSSSSPCVPMADWQLTFYPTCNEFHGHDMVDALSGRNLWILSTKGYWRHAWEVVEQRRQRWTSKRFEKYGHDSSIVLRTFKIEHTYEEGYFENNRVDAIAMERLTKSPYVINMYGFCGMSVVTEYAGQHISQVVDKKKPLEKLQLAKMIAQGVADVHGIDSDSDNDDDSRVSLVHNDLNFANIVIGKNHSRPILNDFNIAVLMLQRNDTHETCPFASHYPNPQWRAPEEQVLIEVERRSSSSSSTSPMTTSHLTAKVDIYALGNVMYRFAVGKSPWKKGNGRSLTWDEKMEIAKMKKINGTMPHVPGKVKQSPDPAVKSLLHIMRECYRHDPKKRPSAKKVVAMLEKAIEEYKELESAARKRILDARAKDAEDSEATAAKQELVGDDDDDDSGDDEKSTSI